ncbi:hypothetical protein [uncultured Sphingobacterium sp.]|nr:hypothetical protein [uncultured Sphingobacterium sp.]
MEIYTAEMLYSGGNFPYRYPLIGGKWKSLLIVDFVFVALICLSSVGFS